MKKTTFSLLCLEGAVLSFNVSAIAALIPSISKDLGVPQFFVGKIVPFYMLPYGIAALFYGPLARRFEIKRIEVSCMFLFSLANLMASLTPDIKTLFFARFLMGVFGASVTPLVLILIAHYGEGNNRGKLIGMFFSITFIASLSGVFLSGIIHWRLIFLIPALCGFLLSFIIYYYLPNFKKQPQDYRIFPLGHSPSKGTNYFSMLGNKKVISIFIYIFFISLVYHGIQQWLAVYFSVRFSFEQFLISMLITLTSFSGIFGEIIGGRLADGIGRVLTAKIGLILMIVSVFFLIFKLPLQFLVLIMYVWGIGWTFNHAGLSTMLTDLPKEFVNEAASLNSSIRFIAGGIGAVLGGIVIQKSFIAHFLIFGLAMVLLIMFAKNLLVALNSRGEVPSPG